MPANPVAENVLGTIGAICWMIQLIPQIWKSWRDKSTEGLSEYLVLLWGLAAAFLGVYAVVQNLNIPLIIQPQIFGILSLISWAQCQYYARKRSFRTSLIMFIAVVALVYGFEAGMIFAIRPSYQKGNRGPLDFFGIASTAIVSIALLPQYLEIYQHHEVVGISVLFMAIDLLGGVFSDLSLAFKQKFDVVAGVTYSLVVLLDGVVIISAVILNPRAERRRKRETTTLPGTELTEETHNTHNDNPDAERAQQLVLGQGKQGYGMGKLGKESGRPRGGSGCNEKNV